MEHRNIHFCAFMFKFYMKAQKHACFHVFIPFSAPLPPLNHNGSLVPRRSNIWYKANHNGKGTINASLASIMAETFPPSHLLHVLE